MAKVVKIDGQLAIILPQNIIDKLGLKEGYYVDLYELKPGVIALTTKKEVAKILLGEQKETKETRKEPKRGYVPEFTGDELELIKKLLKYKFEQRIPEAIDKQLSSVEKKTLSDLIRKRAVTIYKEEKYKEKGVYNIPREVYTAVMQQSSQHTAVVKKEEKKPEVARAVKEEKIEAKEKKEVKELSPFEKLERDGYLVVDSEAEARRLSEELRSRRRDIHGIRGFDKKYYVVKNTFIMKHAKKIRESLASGNKTADQVAAATNLPRGACVAILTIMNEEGEVIEKKRGVFILSE